MLTRRAIRLSGPLLLIATISSIWIYVYDRTAVDAWKTPLTYSADSFFFLAQIKAYADGEFLPFQSKQVARLNAPFVANWNDYPSSMDPVLAAAGWQARITGIFASANISVLLAHLLAGLSFWWVGTRQGYRPGLVFAGSVLFACTHFIFQRNLTHLNLSYYWHVPLMLLVSWWAVTRASTMGRSDEWKAVAICFVAGTFDPYYTVMFLQLLGFAVLFHAVRGQWREARVALLFAFIASIGLLAVNLDTLMYRLVHGPNAAAATRHLVALEAYGMRLPDLFMAPGHHRWEALSEFWRVRYLEPIFESQSAYRKPSFEASSAYIGAAAAIGFLWLAGLSFYHLLRGKLREIPLQAFQLVWILFFSLAGGVNLLLGVFGFQLLRATNRFSVFVVAISLLFLVERLTRLTPRRLVAPAALGLLALGLWDQLPPRATREFTDAVARSVASDRDFVGELEARLPAGSMVFQLPVMDWPESPSVHRVFQNEQMKPYIHSEGLRFSHGSNGGRPREAWQRIVEKLAPAEMASALENYGFAAILVSRRGFRDGGRALVDGLRFSGRPILVASASGDLLAIRLSPSAKPVLPGSGVR